MLKLNERSSETQFGRYDTPRQTPRSRDTNLRTRTTEEISPPIRRKFTAEQARPIQYGIGEEAEAASHEYINESNLPFRLRTNSTTSIDIRPTNPKDGDPTSANVVVAHKATPSNISTSPATSSSNKHSSKRKSSFQLVPSQSETTSSPSLTTANAKAPRKKKVKRGGKKGGSGSVPRPLPTILNVGQPSSVSGSITIPSTTPATSRPTFSLDDTPSFGMNPLPSIPSPSQSPITQDANITATVTATTTASPNSNVPYSTSSDAPFSTPYDEDALLENEIPFPLHKHSGVIIENMGVKKAKNLYKGRESLLNRNIKTVGSDLHLHSGPTLPLTSLNSFCQNTIPFQNNTTPEISAGPSSSTKDAWGCMRLGAADCELSIAFPQTSHYEVWDMDDEAFFACPIFLCLMAKDPRLWAGTPISLPDVSLIDIRCDDLPVPSTMSAYDPSTEYGIQCTVPQNRGWNRGLPAPYSSSQQSSIPFIVHHKEITIEGKWERTYTKPRLQGNHNNTNNNNNNNNNNGQTRILRIADRDGGNTSETTTNGRGWYLKVWIPIPARLFLKRETRVFEIRARVWMMMGEKERGSDALNLMESEGEEDFPLVAKAEMTVSHLRREREMGY